MNDTTDNIKSIEQQPSYESMQRTIERFRAAHSALINTPKIDSEGKAIDPEVAALRSIITGLKSGLPQEDLNLWNGEAEPALTSESNNLFGEG